MHGKTARKFSRREFAALLFGAGLAGGVGGLLGGLLGLAEAEPLLVMLVWDGIVAGFLFFWMIGVVTELQRSEIIDLSRLLHLPVSLRDVFLLNYVSSLVSLSIALVLPGMLVPLRSMA